MSCIIRKAESEDQTAVYRLICELIGSPAVLPVLIREIHYEK